MIIWWLCDGWMTLTLMICAAWPGKAALSTPGYMSSHWSACFTHFSTSNLHWALKSRYCYYPIWGDMMEEWLAWGHTVLRHGGGLSQAACLPSLCWLPPRGFLWSKSNRDLYKIWEERRFLHPLLFWGGELFFFLLALINVSCISLKKKKTNHLKISPLLARPHFVMVAVCY